MNQQTKLITGLIVGGLLSLAAFADEAASAAATYKALTCPAPTSDATWVIRNRNGANQQVDPYLSSLGAGEVGTGIISSPPFILTEEKITFTLCGFDGLAGGQDRNYLTLVDARKGNVLLKTHPPQSDAMREYEWNTRPFRNMEVRIEAHDGNSTVGYAWMGVGRIDAGDAMRVDFREGMPAGWARQQSEQSVCHEDVSGGVPFRRDKNRYTIVPVAGSIEIPCGFAADRLFFLGCKIQRATPLQTYGGIEIHYQDGPPDIIPLMCGFTLDGMSKLLSPSTALHLHPSGDPYQPYLAVKPRNAVIEKLFIVVAHPEFEQIPCISAITCETSAESELLTPLPSTELDAKEAAWIETHTIVAGSIDLQPIMDTIRKDHKLPLAD
ncbi:MAG: hypothetical protein GXY44_08625 [Phycisphaerales bacterium]|nr:hypothetical protein [Phycisphaerales bacterium]